MTTEPPLRTPEWFEYQYNPRITVKDAASIIPEWRRRALMTRERHSPMSDIKYGAHPRENYDLFRAPNAKATMVYIHGGYWRMLSKLETSFVAEHFMAQGISVALINYPLCPDVPLHHIRHSVIRAFAHLHHHTLSKAEKQNIIVAGHSAGGHLAALHLATDWHQHGLPPNPIAGVISLSGVFDVEPLINTSMNTDLRLTPESARSLNLCAADVKSRAKLLLAVGADEPQQFHYQSHALAAAWPTINAEILSFPATNHFTIVDHLAAPEDVLHKAVVEIANSHPAR